MFRYLGEGRSVLKLLLLADSSNSQIIKQLALHMKSNAYLKHLNVRGFAGNKGAKHIADGIDASVSLTSINLSKCQLNAEDAKCIGTSIAKSASLTKVFVIA